MNELCYMIADIWYCKPVLQCKLVSCLFCLLLCSHVRTLQRPRETYYILTTRERKQREGEIQRQILREGTNYIRLLQSCDTLWRLYVEWFQKDDITSQFYNAEYVHACLFFVHMLPWEDTPETKGDMLYNIICIYIYMKRERKQREGEIQRRILREGKDYTTFLQSCITLQRNCLTWLQKYDITNQFYNAR